MNTTDLKRVIREELYKILKEETTSTGDDDLFDDLPAVDMNIDDNGYMSISIQTMFHSPDNGKVAILNKNPEIRERVVRIIQREAQKLFRNTIHKLAGIPFGLD